MNKQATMTTAELMASFAREANSYDNGIDYDANAPLVANDYDAGLGFDAIMTSREFS